MSDVHHQAAIVYDPSLLSYDFGLQHPLRPERITASFDLLEEAGLWDRESETLVPPVCPREVLELVHDSAYIRAVEEAGSGLLPREELARYGLLPGDTPAFPGMHEAAARVTGGSVVAMRAIMNGGLIHAFNPAGGLHHALRARGSGFCVYNDPAVAAAVAVEEFEARVLYLDFDCHHGDGVQWLFYDEPRVLTVSFHESGRFLFPGTGNVDEIGEGAGRGFAVNVPFAPFTQNDSWLEAIHTIVPPLAERFRPDVIISAHGADTHEWDPLTHLSLTTAAFFDQAHLVHQLAHQLSEGRWLAVGSGGYDWRRVVPRSWAIMWAEMTGRPLSRHLPGNRAAQPTNGGTGEDAARGRLGLKSPNELILERGDTQRVPAL
jgi:acetoin utilization protein AcuC